MSRYHACGSLERMLEASQHWKEVALLSDGAVFAKESVWTLPYLQDLKQYFIDQPDEGKDSFFVKLEKQLEATEPEVKQLAAEMLWVIYLCPDNITKPRKLGNIRLVWEWSGKSFPENSDWLAEDVLGGAGNAGTGFNTNIPDEFAFFIRVMIDFKNLPKPERIELLYDGWKFGKWLEQIPECDRRQFRNMIVFLLFPDNFEHIFSGTKRRDIVREFTGKTNAEVNKLLALEIDQELLNIRREKEKEHDTRDLDFYASPLYELWEGSKPENDSEHNQGESQPKTDTMKYSLNQILYGPPGTGKTYNTVNHAVAIIEDKSLDKIEDDKDARQRFRELKQDGQIAIVTFHQNFTYEDFIEGIRPVLDDEDRNIEYELSEGVFKKIADRANKNRMQSEQTDNKSWDMDELLQVFAESMEVRRELGEEINLFPSGDRSGATIGEIYWSGDEKFKSVQLGGTVKYQRLTQKVIRRDYEDFYKGEIKSPKDIKPTHKSRRTQHGNAMYYFALYQKIKQFHDEEWQQEESLPVEKQNYVLIIDEINRGNIARIFGELITLIEPSKRIGSKEDETTVTLPYSKEEFGVPDNLYIIGTMNTADRSIALLDTALRRRFEFIEMMPDSKHDSISTDIEGVNCQKLLAAMNERIHFLLDREHQIGHTYFIGVKRITGRDSLEATFKTKIIPLLQEYFYDDWKKIDLVLNGNGFIEDKSEELRKDILEKLPENKNALGELIDEQRKIYELSDDDDKWKDPKSYQAIYAQGQSETGEAG